MFPVVTSDTTDSVVGRSASVPFTATPFTDVSPSFTTAAAPPSQIAPGEPLPPSHAYELMSSPRRLRHAGVPPATSAVDTTQNTVRIVVRRVVKRTVSPP